MLTYLSGGPSQIPDPNQDQNAIQAQGPQLPTLQIAPNAPVQVTMPQRSSGGAGGGSQLDSATLGKQIAAYLQQKYGASANPPNPAFNLPWADQQAQAAGYSSYAAMTAAGAV